jgi:hypothetical protein
MSLTFIEQLGPLVFYVSLKPEVSLADIGGITDEVKLANSTQPSGTNVMCFDVRRVKKLKFSNFSQMRKAGIHDAVSDLRSLVQIGESDIPLLGFMVKHITTRLKVDYKVVNDESGLSEYLHGSLGLESSETGITDIELLKKRFRKRNSPIFSS